MGAVIRDHVLDSLSCFLYEPLWTTGSLVDVGSGGGLPAVPVGLVRPELDVVLVEATGKKAAFLRRVIEAGGLRRQTVQNDRAENLGRTPEHRERYGAASARALAPLPVLAEYCVPLVRPGGFVLAMKGRVSEEELEEGRQAAHALGAHISAVVEVPLLPCAGDKRRSLVVLTKHAPTPGRYPRRAGVPRKRPLG